MNIFVKTIIVLIIIALIGGALYLFVGVGADSETGGLSFASSATEGGIFSLTTPGLTAEEVTINSSEILQLFKNVSAINLNAEILETPAFAALTSIDVPIAAPTRIGRINPFLEIGSDGKRASVIEVTIPQNSGVSSEIEKDVFPVEGSLPVDNNTTN
ncbi:MAG: hypothetical protein ACI83D_000133 [Planctomycetota bacterium]|jgi:hypothetical protein